MFIEVYNKQHFQNINSPAHILKAIFKETGTCFQVIYFRKYNYFEFSYQV